MTETVGLRERIAEALYEAFRDGFEAAYGERPEGLAETSEYTREVWRKEADALLPTGGEPVAWQYRWLDSTQRWTRWFLAYDLPPDEDFDGRPYEHRPLFATPQESAEVQRLREAVQPFVDAAEAFDDSYHTDDLKLVVRNVYGRGEDYSVTVGDFRRLRAALNPETDG